MRDTEKLDELIKKLKDSNKELVNNSNTQEFKKTNFLDEKISDNLDETKIINNVSELLREDQKTCELKQSNCKDNLCIMLIIIIAILFFLILII